MWMRFAETFVTSAGNQLKRPPHVVFESTIFPVNLVRILYTTFRQFSQGDNSSLAATALLAKVDKKRNGRWSEAIRSIYIIYIKVKLLMRLVGSRWGAGFETLRTVFLSLIYSTAEYCAPGWCLNTHTRLIDSVLNDALRIVTG